MEPKSAEDAGALAAAASSFPLLVYDYYYDDEPEEIFQTVLSVADGSTRTIQVPEMCEYTCLETPQGLVLMVDAAAAGPGCSCSLWSPQNGEKTALPDMAKGDLPEHGRCLLSHATASPPDSLVLVYDLTRPELLFCRINGGAAWVKQSYDMMGLYEVPGKVPTARTIGDVAAVEGTFYYLQSRDVVGTLGSLAADQPEQPRLDQLGTFDARLPRLATDADLTVTKCFLLESSRELFLVCLFYVGCTLEHVEEIGAYVMDFDEHEWCKVTDIGDRAFLLGPEGFAASCSAMEHGLRKGCVYFACDFLGESNDFYIFDLNEGTREVVKLNQDIPLLSREPFWIVPLHS